MKLCANNPSEWVLGVSKGPMARGGMQGGGKEKRRYLERESGKVLVVWWCGGGTRGFVDVDAWQCMPLHGAGMIRSPVPPEWRVPHGSVDRPKTTNSVLLQATGAPVRVLSPDTA
jgi:hypothetical protein